MVTIELHKCDRCGKTVEVPVDSLHKVSIGDDEQVDEHRPNREVCFLCFSALSQYYQYGEIKKYRGVVEHEEKFRENGEWMW